MRQYSVAAADAKFCLQLGAELASLESGGKCIKNQIPGPHLRISRGACSLCVQKSSGNNSNGEPSLRPTSKMVKSTNFGSIRSFMPQMFTEYVLCVRHILGTRKNSSRPKKKKKSKA